MFPTTKYLSLVIGREKILSINQLKNDDDYSRDSASTFLEYTLPRKTTVFKSKTANIAHNPSKVLFTLTETEIEIIRSLDDEMLYFFQVDLHTLIEKYAHTIKDKDNG